MPQQSNWLVPSKYQNWLGVAILSVAGWVLVQRLSAWKDLAFGDETTYLASGITFSIPFVGGAQWGPLYAAWYAFWHLFIPDRLDLYYFNYALLSVLAGVLVFVYLRSSKVPFWPGIWIAVLFLFSSQNLPLDPKISIAPFCLILAGLSVVQSFDLKSWQKMLIVAFTGLLCAYCRPEFYLAFLLATVLSVWFFLAQRTVFSKAVWGQVALFGVGVIALHLLFKNPLFSGDGSRSAVAFQQHFIINYTNWNALPNLNTIEAQLKLYHQVFGNEVESMTDALQSKPSLVLKHILINVKNTLLINAQNALDIFYQTPLHGWYSRWRMVAFGLALLVFLGNIDYRKTRQFKSKKAFNGVHLLALLVLIFPALVAAVLVYPRTHYLVFHALLLLWLAGLLAQSIVFKPLRWAGAASALGLVLFLTWRYSLSAQAPTPSADNVRFINQLRYQKEVVSLEREWYRVFLKAPSIWIHVEQYTGGDFAQFVQAQRVNFILMTRDMQQYFAKDPGFKVFETNAQKYGFVRLTTNPEGEYLLVKSDLIKPM